MIDHGPKKFGLFLSIDEMYHNIHAIFLFSNLWNYFSQMLLKIISPLVSSTFTFSHHKTFQLRPFFSSSPIYARTLKEWEERLGLISEVFFALLHKSSIICMKLISWLIILTDLLSTRKSKRYKKMEWTFEIWKGLGELF